MPIFTLISKLRLGRAPLFLLVFIACATFLPFSGFSEEKSLAIIYPDVQPPYSTVFSNIISGIEEHTRTPLKRYLMSKNVDDANVREWLANEKPAAIIALGQRGLEVARGLDSKTPIVIGAVMLSNDIEPNIAGISLAADPAKLFEQMQSLTKDIKRVFAVYTSSQNDWLIELAKKAAATHHLELVAYPAQDIQQSAMLYQDILHKSDSASDALWLLSDKSLDEDAILSMILKVAWERKLVVFSSNPGHAKKGALFSLYPDNHALGGNLADMAEERLSNPQQAIAIVPLSSLLTAVNIRTADHLGLSISNEQLRQVGLIFPTP
ncbi:MAG TPA: ABC transporter substrate binding protein [Gammaproteobacteria bacterium]|nr:ABC transporter substrate binding protein [Gammaproteobacteria bacterium]